jgi:hypothetical protein
VRLPNPKKDARDAAVASVIPADVLRTIGNPLRRDRLCCPVTTETPRVEP